MDKLCKCYFCSMVWEPTV